MKASYYNRYGDDILFEEIENEIHMSGFNMDWMRYGWSNEDEKKIIMVDPSGGPYITLGSDLGLYFGDRKKRIIESIKIDNENKKVIFKIKQQ